MSLEGRIAILIGIPTTEEEFHQRVPYSDWLKKYHDPGSTIHEQQCRRHRAWRQLYSGEVARPTSTLMSRAKQLGVRVVPRSRLSDLSLATANHGIVIVFSHWKGPEFAVEDIAQSMRKSDFAARLHSNDSPMARWLVRHYAKTSVTKQVSKKEQTKTCCKSQFRHIHRLLNEALSVDFISDSIIEESNVPLMEQPITRRSRRRDALDDIFQGLLRPGNRLELFDGLHAKEDIERAIDPRFEGILDLTTCTSAPAADYIDGHRNHRIRTVHFDVPLLPIWAAKCVELTLEVAYPFSSAGSTFGMKHGRA